jgi:hypothetical protein
MVTIGAKLFKVDDVKQTAKQKSKQLLDESDESIKEDSGLTVTDYIKMNTEVEPTYDFRADFKARVALGYKKRI